MKSLEDFLKGFGLEQRIKFGGLITAVIILIVILANNLSRGRQTAREEEGTRPVSAPRQGDAEQYRHESTGSYKPKTVPKEIQAIISSLGRDDPFVVPSFRTISYDSDELSLTLVGIIWEVAKPLAIVNDSIVAEGEIVDGKEVLRIERDAIILKENNKETTLRLGESTKRRR